MPQCNYKADRGQTKFSKELIKFSRKFISINCTTVQQPPNPLALSQLPRYLLQIYYYQVQTVTSPVKLPPFPLPIKIQTDIIIFAPVIVHFTNLSHLLLFSSHALHPARGWKLNYFDMKFISICDPIHSLARSCLLNLNWTIVFLIVT